MEHCVQQLRLVRYIAKLLPHGGAQRAPARACNKRLDARLLDREAL